MLDSQKINPFVYAHQQPNGQWLLHDRFKNEMSRETYATQQEARTAYHNGETTWE